ncbi:hypothetical protein BGZ63DRAFT_98095 [Mariannaea sp. PMI_226]|nr:hypothetical protein BGZ63DRAFT_98095 [Mariannaea sp. PMI_226]
MPVEKVSALSIMEGREITRELMTIQNLEVAEIRQVSSQKLDELTTKLVEDLFRDFNVNKDQNLGCFRATVTKLKRSRLWTPDRLFSWDGYENIRSTAFACKHFHSAHKKICMMPAPKMLMFWAAVNVRQLPNTLLAGLTSVIRKSQLFRYLDIAIAVWPQHQGIFVIEDRAIKEPVVTHEKISGITVVWANTSSPTHMEISVQRDTNDLFGRIEDVPSWLQLETSDDEIDQQHPPKEQEQLILDRLQDVRQARQSNLDTNNNVENRLVTIETIYTRQEAMDMAGDLFDLLEFPMRASGVNLDSRFDDWISDEHILLLTERHRHLSWQWLKNNGRDHWAAKIQSLPQSFPDYVVRTETGLQPRVKSRVEKQVSDQLGCLDAGASHVELVNKCIDEMRFVYMLSSDLCNAILTATPRHVGVS